MRVANALLTDGKAYKRGYSRPMVDLKYGGQQGFTPNFTEWTSNAAYIRRNMICLLIEAPTGFLKLNNPEYWIGTLKVLLEQHATVIEGMNSSLSVDTADHPVGGSGEIQKEITNVTLTPSAPSFTFIEKYGMPIEAFFNGWVRNLMMDPESKFANIMTLPGVRQDDLLPDVYAATCLFIEPDATHTKVVKAWLSTNMFPTGQVTTVEGRRDLASASDITTYNVEFSAITQIGAGVNAFAQDMLNNINITGANPFLRDAFIKKVQPEVKDAPVGYAKTIENQVSQALTNV